MDTIDLVFSGFDARHRFAEGYRLLRQTIETGAALGTAQLVDLYPLVLPNEQVLRRRRPTIEIAASTLRADDSENKAFRQEFRDPAMGKFWVGMPARLEAEGSVVNNSELLVRFSPTPAERITVELPLIAEQGLPRSVYQTLVEIRWSEEQFISLHEDGGIGGAGRFVSVLVDMTGTKALRAGKRVSETKSTGGKTVVLLPCSKAPDLAEADDDVEERNWFVYEEQGLCNTHSGSGVKGGMMRYNKLAENLTQAEADAWIRSHPDKCPLN